MYTTITVRVSEDTNWDRDAVEVQATMDLSQITDPQNAAVTAAMTVVQALLYEAYGQRITLLEEAEADRKADAEN